MANYEGINFPTGVNKGDTFHQTVSGITYEFQGGDTQLVGNWKVIQTGQDAANVSIVDESKTRYLELDNLTRAALVVQIEHHRVHEGYSFTYRDVITLSSAAAQDYVLVTPVSVPYCHFGYEVASQLQITTEMFRGTDKAPTTIQTTFNRSEIALNNASMLLYKGSSGGTTDGTRILWRVDGSTTAGGRALVQVGEAQERILKPNTKYIFRVTSGANNNVISVRLSWYEHTND